MNTIHDEDDSEEEDEAEGIDIDLEDDGIEAEQDDNNWINYKYYIQIIYIKDH